MKHLSAFRHSLLTLAGLAFIVAGFFVEVPSIDAEGIRALAALEEIEAQEYQSSVPQENGVYLLSQSIAGASSGDNFGYSVAISGDYAVVGAPYVGDDVGAAYVYKRVGAQWVYQHSLTITSASPTPNDRYGWSVDIDGDTIIVGAPGRDIEALDNRGSAYIYTLTNGTFQNEVTLVNSCDYDCGRDPDGRPLFDAPGDQFGISVAVDGDVAIVGAFLDRVNPPVSGGPEGSASRFIRTSGTWNPTGVKTKGANTGSNFGVSVATSGDIILVGAPYDQGGLGGVFRYGSGGISWGTPGAGSPTPTPNYIGQVVGSGFGKSVAVYSGTAVDPKNEEAKDVVVLGAPDTNRPSGNNLAGAVFVSERVGTKGSFSTMTEILPSATPINGDEFGYGVSIDGDMLIVGTTAEKAVVFRDTGSDWEQRRLLEGANPGFGNAVGVDQNKLLVGEPGSTNGTALFYVNAFPRTFDWEGDDKANISVFRPSGTPTWYIDLPPSSYTSHAFGLATDLVAPADFDGDRRMDIAVFRGSTSTDWYIRDTATTNVSYVDFGSAGDIAMPGDFDGDGKADVAVFRESENKWYWQRSSDDGVESATLNFSGAKPILGDFNGDGKADPAVFYFDSGYMYWRWYDTITDTVSSAVQFGVTGDKPVSGDFDGDLKTDYAVYRPSDQTWYRLYSSNSSLASTQFGQSTDIPAVADYDGDGESDIAVFRPSTGYWYIAESRSGSAVSTPFGSSGDMPLPGAYNQ